MDFSISNILDIPINSICKDNPYEDMETLPKLSSDKERLMINIEKKAYFSDRTLNVIKKFDYTELPIIDQLIAYFHRLQTNACRPAHLQNRCRSFPNSSITGAY